jgi:hypothetical protein
MLETSLGAIARLRDFEIETKAEAKEGENLIPPQNWPSRGLIQIEDVTAAYKFVLGYLEVQLLADRFQLVIHSSSEHFHDYSAWSESFDLRSHGKVCDSMTSSSDSFNSLLLQRQKFSRLHNSSNPQHLIWQGNNRQSRFINSTTLSHPHPSRHCPTKSSLHPRHSPPQCRSFRTQIRRRNHRGTHQSPTLVRPRRKRRSRR